MYSRIVRGEIDERVGECLCVSGRAGLRGTDGRIEHWRIVEVFLVVIFGGQIAATLLGDDVDHDGALGRQFLGVAQRGLELGEVVAVERADVAHTERLEERRRRGKGRGGCAHLLGQGIEGLCRDRDTVNRHAFFDVCEVRRGVAARVITGRAQAALDPLPPAALMPSMDMLASRT